MDLIAPLLFGIAGRYHFMGFPIDFVDRGTPLITKLVVGILSGNYFSTFVHELGHAVSHYTLTGRIGNIYIISNGDGYIMYDKWNYIYPNLTPLQECINSLSGPLASSSFTLIKSMAIRRYETWLRKRQNGHIGKYQFALLTLLKVQNLIAICFDIFQPISLLMDHNQGSDFQNIYKYGGMSSAIGATVLIGVISAFSIKIMSNDIRVEQPLSSKAYNSLKAAVDRARQTTYEVNLIAMGIMKSAIDLVGSPLVVQMNAKKLG